MLLIIICRTKPYIFSKFFVRVLKHKVWAPKHSSGPVWIQNYDFIKSDNKFLKTLNIYAVVFYYYVVPLNAFVARFCFALIDLCGQIFFLRLSESDRFHLKLTVRRPKEECIVFNHRGFKMYGLHARNSFISNDCDYKNWIFSHKYAGRTYSFLGLPV